MTEHVAPAPHEFAANFIYDSHGLDPYFGTDRAVKDADGHKVASFDASGEEWTAELTYQKSGLDHPGPTTPTGTAFSIETVREFRVTVTAGDDEQGQRSFNIHLAPRWRGMESDGSEIALPPQLDEGVNLSVKGSNIAFDLYPELIAEAMDAVGVRSYYFLEPADYSNVKDAEMYVRLDKDRSGPVHAREGPIAKLGHLLESDRSGYRKVVQNDTDEHGRDLPGYYHTATLGPERVRRALDDHTFPREIKHYYAREAKSLEGALEHPKLGSSYQVNRWDETIGVTPDELDELEQQLSETVLSILAAAGITTHVEGPDDPFVDDAYFAADSRCYDRDPLRLADLTELESKQENVVISHLADGFSPVEWEALETLVADGGVVSPTSIADSNGRHVDSVRRALNRIPELVEHSYGEVKLRSDHLAELVTEAVEEARESVRQAVAAGSKARLAAESGRSEETSALMAYCARFGIDIDDSTEARLELRMNRETVRDRLTELYRLWCNSGRDPARIRSAQLRFDDGSFGKAWRFLKAT